MCSFLSDEYSSVAVCTGRVSGNGRILSAEDNQPLIGVSVLEKGTSNGVITDIDGNYSITVTKSPATLQFSYIGMRPVDRQVTASTRIDLSMESDAQQVDEVVVVAYGVRKKGTIAGSVSTVKAEKDGKCACRRQF